MIERAAPAKVNLFLHITGRRADGYHLLESLAVFPRLGDVVAAEPAHGLSLAIAGPFKDQLGADGDNLVIRAAEALRRATGLAAGASLLLDKRLPIASGVGGGSSDAAATLRALLALWRAELSPEALDRLALSLGADVPVCLRAPAATWMAGVGERLKPGPRLPNFWMTLANPGVALATGAVFAGLSRRDAPPPPAPPARFATLAALADWLHAKTRNDLEPPAIALAPAIAGLRDALSAAPGCALARMSGSGATCYGLFETRGEAEAAAERLRSERPGTWSAAAPVTEDDSWI